MNVKSKNDRKLFPDKLTLVCLIFILLWFSFESVRIRIDFLIVCIVYMIWFSLVLLKNPKFLNKILYHCSFMILWVLVIAFRTVLGIGALTPELIYGTTLLMIYFIFIYYKDKNIEYKRVIFVTIITSYVLTGLITLYFLSIDSNLVRRSAAGLLDHEHYLGLHGTIVMNIGGWDYIYSLVGVVIVFIYLIRSKKDRLSNIIFLILIFFFISVILRASLSTAVLMLFLLIIIIYSPRNANSKIVYISLISTIILLSIPFLHYLLRVLSVNISNEGFIYKLDRALQLVSGEITLSEFYTRSILFQNSFRTFITSPIAGVYGFFEYDHTIVSGHSQWIDDLARHGLFFQVLFYSGVFQIVKSLLNYSKDIMHRKLTRTILIYLFIFGFLNPTLLIHNYILMFLVVPFSSSIIYTKSDIAYKDNKRNSEKPSGNYSYERIISEIKKPVI